MEIVNSMFFTLVQYCLLRLVRFSKYMYEFANKYRLRYNNHTTYNYVLFYLPNE